MTITENSSSWIKMINFLVWTQTKTNHSWQESLSIVWSVNFEQSCWSDEMSRLLWELWGLHTKTFFTRLQEIRKKGFFINCVLEICMMNVILNGFCVYHNNAHWIDFTLKVNFNRKFHQIAHTKHKLMAELLSPHSPTVLAANIAT